MKKSVMKEQPLYTLQGSSYNGIGDVINVYASDLAEAPVGKRWFAGDTHNCGRGKFEESLELVYKTAQGCACLHRTEGTCDSPEAEEWIGEPELIWFELA